jgi:hypothetical protein
MKPNPLRQALGTLWQRLWGLPDTFRAARKQSRRRKILAQGEVERLDRIRNPAKYRGK